MKILNTIAMIIGYIIIGIFLIGIIWKILTGVIAMVYMLVPIFVIIFIITMIVKGNKKYDRRASVSEALLSFFMINE